MKASKPILDRASQRGHPMKIVYQKLISDDNLKALANYYAKSEVNKSDVLIWVSAVIDCALDELSDSYLVDEFDSQ
jgi:hypothetical protein